MKYSTLKSCLSRLPFIAMALFVMLGVLGPYAGIAIAQEVVLKFGMPDQIDNFNPLIGLFATAGYARGFLYDTLIHISANGTYIPWLAESYSVDTEKLVIRFTLRRGAYWHDGRPITAQDVEFTFNLIIASNYTEKPDKWGLGNYIQYVRALDDRTVEFKLKEPCAPALFYIGALIPPSPDTYGRGSIQQRLRTWTTRWGAVRSSS